jgi:diacylglycerol kinase family enzyme
VRPVRGFLLINPRAGTESPTPDELAAAAQERGIEARLLREGEDAAELARAADADVLGAAGGDGSVATVAAVAIERDLRRWTPSAARSGGWTSGAPASGTS